MGLPHELLLYAENFYRRFPEEFVALGMPGLEEIFDLRPHGTKSRRISETPIEKTVEITIRRWQAPSLLPAPSNHYSLPIVPALLGTTSLQGAHYSQSGPGPSHAWPSTGGPASQGACYTQGGCGLPPVWPSPNWPQELSYAAAHGPGPLLPAAQASGSLPPAAWPPQRQPEEPAAATEDDSYASAQLARLEAAVMMLKPQVEAALASQARAAQAPAQLPTAAQALAPAEGTASAPVVATPTAASAQPAARSSDGTAVSEHSPESPLRERRRLQSLSIVRPDNQVPKGAILQSAPVKEIAKSSSEPPKPSDTRPQGGDAGKAGGQPQLARSGTKEMSRPQALNAVRVASSMMDPESPRSPGKYSAWK